MVLQAESRRSVQLPMTTKLWEGLFRSLRLGVQGKRHFSFGSLPFSCHFPPSSSFHQSCVSSIHAAALALHLSPLPRTDLFGMGRADVSIQVVTLRALPVLFATGLPLFVSFACDCIRDKVTARHNRIWLTEYRARTTCCRLAMALVGIIKLFAQVSSLVMTLRIS